MFRPHGPGRRCAWSSSGSGARAGLLSPHVGWNGLGLDHRAKAIVFEAGGYPLLGPVALNGFVGARASERDDVAAPRRQKGRMVRISGIASASCLPSHTSSGANGLKAAAPNEMAHFAPHRGLACAVTATAGPSRSEISRRIASFC